MNFRWNIIRRINSGNNSSNITIFIRKQRFVNDPADCKMDEPYK